MNPKAVIFDLDGTLLNTLDDLADAANRALIEYGFPTHEVDKYRHFIGSGVWELMQRTLPPESRQEETIQGCVDRMRAIYKENWAMKTRPYPGIPELLAGLEQRGLMVSVLTNKPQDFTQLMIDHFFPEVGFHTVFGARPGVPLKPEPDGAQSLFKAMDIEPWQAVMLGDSSVDMQAAVASGMIPVGAGWGFRGRQELLVHGAVLVIDNPLDLLNEI